MFDEKLYEQLLNDSSDTFGQWAEDFCWIFVAAPFYKSRKIQLDLDILGL